MFVIVGSGIAADRLSSDGGIELLTHAIAVGAGLGAMIGLLATISGAHFNPAVAVGIWLTGAITPLMAVAQMVAGVAAAGVAFALCPSMMNDVDDAEGTVEVEA